FDLAISHHEQHVLAGLVYGHGRLVGSWVVTERPATGLGLPPGGHSPPQPTATQHPRAPRIVRQRPAAPVPPQHRPSHPPDESQACHALATTVPALRTPKKTPRKRE